MLSTLKYRPPTTNKSEWTTTKLGIPIYGGAAAEFHDYEFQIKCRLAGTKAEDLKGLGAKILEGLRGEAFSIARDLGPGTISAENGAEKILDALRLNTFPNARRQAKALYLAGHKSDGILTRQRGESMYSYCQRRRTWYDRLTKCDNECKISDYMLGQLLLDLSQLDRNQKDIVRSHMQTDVREQEGDFERCERALLELHPEVGKI